MDSGVARSERVALIDGNDPDHPAYSLSNFAEIIFPCLDAIGARSVLEIGAFKGTTTRELLKWAGGAGGRVTAVEPAPQEDLLALKAERPELELAPELSLNALRDLSLPDALLLDGDHNYYTLSRELALIYKKAPGARMPLLFLHDVAWPLARRDQYAAPQRIPAEHRQPYSHKVSVAPGETGIAAAGLSYEWVASEEGGPRNGVLTAIEDFVNDQEGIRFALIPAFFGLGVLWHEGAPWAAKIAEIVAPLDRNPIMQRLEENRVAHLVARRVVDLELAEARRRRTHWRRQLTAPLRRLGRQARRLRR